MMNVKLGKNCQVFDDHVVFFVHVTSKMFGDVMNDGCVLSVSFTRMRAGKRLKHSNSYNEVVLVGSPYADC